MRRKSFSGEVKRKLRNWNRQCNTYRVSIEYQTTPDLFDQERELLTGRPLEGKIEYIEFKAPPGEILFRVLVTKERAVCTVKDGNGDHQLSVSTNNGSVVKLVIEAY